MYVLFGLIIKISKLLIKCQKSLSIASCVRDLAQAKVVNVLILSKSWEPSTNPHLLCWKCSSTLATLTASSRLILLSPS